MAPIVSFFENVNRTVIIVKPKSPFNEWLKSIEAENQNYNIEYNSDINLLPDFEEEQQIENWLKRNFDKIFCDQMNNWYTNESLWIKNRTFKMFKQYFNYSMHLMIWDTSDKPIEKE